MWGSQGDVIVGQVDEGIYSVMLHCWYNEDLHEKSLRQLLDFDNLWIIVKLKILLPFKKES